MKRGILVGGGIVVVVVAAAAVYFLSSLDSIIRAAVEEYGSAATRANVALREVEISTTSGKAALRGLVVGNPEGFDTDNAFSLGEVSVTLDTGTLTSDTIVIKEVVIAAPQITYEVGSGGSNIAAIQKNVEAYAAGFGGTDKKTEKAKDDEGPKLIIEHLYVRNGAVNVSATFLKGKKLGAALPDIHLKDIGKDKGGASPAEVAKEVFGALGKSSRAAVNTLGLGKMMNAAKDAASGAVRAASDAASAATGTAKEAASGAVDAAKDGADKAGGALKKLFGK